MGAVVAQAGLVVAGWVATKIASESPGKSPPGGTSGVKLSVGDVEEMNPVRLLVNKRKDISLSDEQLKQVKDIDGRLKELNKSHVKALDSLRTASRPRTGGGLR